MGGFVINVNGEPVWEAPEGSRVTRLGLQTKEGESGAAGIDPTQTAANIMVEFDNANEVTLADTDLIKNPPNQTPDQVDRRAETLAELRAGGEAADADVPNRQAEGLTSTALVEPVDEEKELEAASPAPVEDEAVEVEDEDSFTGVS